MNSCSIVYKHSKNKQVANTSNFSLLAVFVYSLAVIGIMTIFGTKLKTYLNTAIDKNWCKVDLGYCAGKLELILLQNLNIPNMPINFKFQMKMGFGIKSYLRKGKYCNM